MKTTPPSFFSTQVKDSVLFHHDRPKTVSGIAVIAGGMEPCRPDYVMDRSTFPYHCIEFVAAGSCALDLGRGPVTLGPGSVFTYGPDIAHRISATAGSPLVKYFVDFTGPRAFAALSDAGLAPGTVARCVSPQDLVAVWDGMIRLAQTERAHGAELAFHSLAALMALLTDTCVPHREPKPAERSFARLRDHLDRNFLTVTDLDSACRAVDLDPAYGCRLFRTYGGTSPWKYLLHRRMQHAAAILHRGEAKVTEVARAMGYPDPYTFSRAFKKAMGVAPKYLRV